MFEKVRKVVYTIGDYIVERDGIYLRIFGENNTYQVFIGVGGALL